MSPPEPKAGIGNWDDLRYFIAVAHGGTLAQAARDLGVKVSTVHRRIAALEEDWGVQLFQRTPKGHTPTEDAQSLLHDALGVEAAVHRLSASLANVDPRPVLRLTTTDDLVDFLSPVIARFCAQHPVQVRLLVAEKFYNLAQREVDLAIRFTQTVHEELIVRDLPPMAFALYASHDYLANMGAQHPGPARLEDHRFIAAEAQLAQAPPHQRLLRELAPAQVVAFANTVSTMAAMARGGLGVAALPRLLGDRDPGLQWVAISLEDSDVTPQLVYHYRSRGSQELKALIDHIERAFAQESGPLD